MGLHFPESSLPDWTLFLYRESDTSYVQLTSQDGLAEQSERFVLSDQNNKWPSLEVSEQPTSFQYLPYSVGAVTTQPTATIWQLNPEDIASHPKIHHLDTQGLPRHLLIDRSGTMARVSEASNPLAQIFLRLNEQRKLEGKTWFVHSFSNQLSSHDTWEPNGTAPVEVFQKSSGQTRLLDALDQLSQKITRPAEIIVVSDGELDTQHRLSIERTLVQLKQDGISLHLLSPELQPVRSWAPYYQKHLVDPNWPALSSTERAERMSETKRVLVSDGETTVQWEDADPTVAHADLTPILFSPIGRALLYLDTSREQPTYFAVGRPQRPELLKLALLKRHHHRPTIQFTHQQLIIDVGSPSLDALATVTPDAAEYLPQSPGIYRLDWINAHRIRFYHPVTGAFTLSQLQLWKNFVESNETEGRDAVHWPRWRLATLRSRIESSDSYIWKGLLLTQLCWFLTFLFPSSRLLTWRVFKPNH